MKNIGIFVLVFLIVAVLVLCFVSFQVRETESALVTTFGDPTKSIVEPGWYWKWPVPIQRVHKFDSRMRLYEGIMEETNTKGGEPIVVTSYMVWKIDDPQKFLEALRTVEGAEKQLRGQFRDTQNSVVGKHYFSEFVNTDLEKIRFSAIEDEMLESLRASVSDEYGISIEAVGIKQLGVSEKVTEDVFARMMADRRRKAEATLAEGKAEATKIRTDSEKKRTVLLAVAEARAKAIRGRGDAEAAKYYKLLEEDPELAMFLREIEALKKILKHRSTVVLSAESRPFKLLKEMPDIRPKR